jgi:hypothetical protein
MVRRALVILLLVLAMTQGASATTLVPLSSTGRIELYYEPGLESDARRLRDVAEEALARISDDLVDLNVPRSVRVQLVRDSSSLASVAPGGRGAPAWAIGMAYPDLGVVSVAMRRGATINDPVQTLRHELAHIALGTALGPRAPHWLHEGFASQHSMEWSWDRTETLAGMAWFGGIVALEELDRSFPKEENPAHRAYAQSYDFVGFLSRRGRWDDTADDGDRWPFRRFLTAVGNGTDIDVAAKKAYGKPLAELFDEWRTDLSKRYLLAPIGLLGLAVWVLCAVLLALAWARKKRINRRRLGEWEREERDRDDAMARMRAASQAAIDARAGAVLVAPPAYVAWPGENPLAAGDDDEPPATPGTKLLN